MTDLVVSLPSDGLSEMMGEMPGVEFVEWDLGNPPPRDRIDIVVPGYLAGTEPLAALVGVDVGLVQWQAIGFDGAEKYVPRGMLFANAATVHEASTAELALALALAVQREIPEFVRAGDRGEWASGTRASLADRRVALVGYGGVSKAIEARLAGFEVTIERVARTARQTQNAAGQTVEVHGLDSLHDVLSRAEIAMIAVPLSADTRGLIGAEALAAMPDGALLINVARGPVVDTDALVKELQAGRLRAGLDVTDPEPLPRDHPLWSTPGTLISPHVGGDTSSMQPRMAALIRRQIARMQAGEPPENVVLGAAY